MPPEPVLPKAATLPSAVLFDMDGTLIDSEHIWLAAELLVMAELGGEWEAADQTACLGGPLERVVDRMIEKSGGGHDEDEVGTMLMAEVARLLRETPLAWRPGARFLLAEARAAGIPTALVSASWNRIIDAVAHKMTDDLGGTAFDAIVAGDDVELGKPHPEPYLTAASSLGVIPSMCLALEDSPTGVRSAVAAGCRVVAIPHVAPIANDGAYNVDTLAGWDLSALWRAAEL
jgi:HAD superfamily hydrolase (TIGR01509 family)